MVRFLLASLLLVCAFLPMRAQTDSLVTVLREVSVTAAKQTTDSELAASTVVGAKEIDRLNIVTMKDVSELVPNLYMPSYGSRMTSSIYVRGLGARIDQPVVGLNVDGVSYLNKDNYDFDLFDIERIDVYRGAQSILNGRNTMAGQINITTLSPWRYQGVRALAEYGRGNSYKLGIGGYTRLSDKYASSLTAYITGTDGFYRNAHDGKRIDTENQQTLRWKVMARPGSSLSWTNALSAQFLRQGGYPYRNIATGLIAHDDTCYYWRNSVSDAFTLSLRTKELTLTSQTSAQFINDNMTLDQDFLPIPYFTLTQRRNERAFTEDLFAKGNVGSFNWLVGTFAFAKVMNMAAPVTFKDEGIRNLIEKHPNEMNPAYPISWWERTFVLGSNFRQNTSGIAIYQQSSYTSGPWRVELGLRYDVERAVLNYHSHCNSGYDTWHVEPDGTHTLYSHNPVDIDEHGRLHHTFIQLLPKVAVGYTTPSGTAFYANVTKGYKAGGFNTQMFSDVLQQKVMELMGLTMKYDVDDIVTYRPEKSWNYEVGAKGSAGDRLDWSATLYYISCIDQQLTAFPDGTTTGRIMTNAGRTRSYGAELTAFWRPAATLLINGSYGYTNARFVKYNNGKDDLSGKRLPYAPSNTAFLSLTYFHPRKILGMSMEANINARGIGDIYWNDANTLCQPFYMMCGASVAVTSSHWSLRLWGENITDTRYDTFYFMSMGNQFLQRGNPVTWGVTLRVF